MSSVREKLVEFDALVERAVAQVDRDSGVSSVLKAVLGDFQRKSKKALQGAAAAAPEQQVRLVVELEQAADSAKYAAQADPGCSEASRNAVVAAHDPICGYKHELTGTP